MTRHTCIRKYHRNLYILRSPIKQVMSDSLFVALEGIDGSGKTTVINSLKKQREDIYYTKEPTESWVGNWARQCVQYDETHPLTDFYMLQADRAHHLQEEIFPALEEGRTVVTDRYVDSTRAYQSVALDPVLEEPHSFIDAAMRPFPEPDIVLYIDIPAEEGIERCSGDDKFEQLDFLKQVRSNYQSMAASRENIKRIEGQRHPSDVADGVRNLISVFEEEL